MKHKRLLIALLILFAAVALATGAYVALRVSLVVVLVGATLLVVVLGFIAQAGGILSREGPK